MIQIVSVRLGTSIVPDCRANHQSFRGFTRFLRGGVLRAMRSASSGVNGDRESQGIGKRASRAISAALEDQPQVLKSK